jgi:hypothetical protein
MTNEDVEATRLLLALERILEGVEVDMARKIEPGDFHSGQSAPTLSVIPGAVVCDDGLCYEPCCDACGQHLSVVGGTGGPAGDGAPADESQGWLGEVLEGCELPTEFLRVEFQTSPDVIWKCVECGVGHVGRLVCLN